MRLQAWLTCYVHEAIRVMVAHAMRRTRVTVIGEPSERTMAALVYTIHRPSPVRRRAIPHVADSAVLRRFGMKQFESVFAITPETFVATVERYSRAD